MANAVAPLEWETPVASVEPASIPLEPFASETQKAKLPEEVVRDRAEKAHVALADNSPGIGDLIGEIQSGLEDDIRERLVNDEYFKQQKSRQNLVSEYFATKGMAAEDPGEVAYVQQLSKSEPERLATIIEKKYAANRVDFTLAGDETGAVDRVDQEKLDDKTNWAINRIVAKERAQTLLEEIDAEYDQQGWWRKTKDIAKGFIPLYNSYGVTNVAPEGVDSEGVFASGDVLRQQFRDLFAMSPEAQEDWFNRLRDEVLADPSKLQYARQFLEGVQSYTAVQAQVDNFSNYVEGGLELTPLGIVGPLAKGVFKVGAKVATAKAVQGAAKEAVLGGASKGGSATVAEAAVAPSKAAAEATPKEATAEAVFNAASGPKVVNQDGLVAAPQKVGHRQTTWVVGEKRYSSAREVEAAVERLKGDQAKRARLLSNEEELVKYASDRGETPEAMRKLLTDNRTYQQAILGTLEEIAASDNFKALQATEKAAAGKIKFNDKTDKRWNPETGMVEDIPHMSVDVPNPKTGEKAKVSVPVNDETTVAAQLEATTNDAMRPTVDHVETIAAHGESDNAAILEAIQQIEDEIGKPVIPGDLEGLTKGLKRNLLSFFDPFTKVVGRVQTKDKYKEVLRRAMEFKSVIKSQKEIADLLLNAWRDGRTSGVIRITEPAMEKIKPIMDEKFRKEFSSANDSILDIETIRETDPKGLRVNGRKFILGYADKTFFPAWNAAKYHADNILKLQDGYYAIEPRGKSFVVTVTKVMDEMDKSYAKALINTKTKTPVSWASAFFSYLKGGAAGSSEWLATNLKASAHHANALHTAFGEVAKEIRLKTKEEVESLNQLLTDMRDATVKDPATGDITRGKWAKDAVEFDRMFKTAFSRPPTEAQQKAYFAVRSLHDFDMVTRNMNLYTDIARMAYEEFQVFLPVATDALPEQGIAAGTKWIKHQQTTLMKVVDELPKNQADNDILILDADGVTHHLISKAKDGTAKVDEFLAKGYKILQIFNPDQKPFRHINDNFVEFVIARDFERRPLGLDRLPYTEGGHVRTAESEFVKQMKFETTSNGTKTYTGDKTYSGHSSPAEAKVWRINTEKARLLLKAGDDKALEAHLLSNTPENLIGFKRKFQEYRKPDGTIQPALFDIDLPFANVSDGQGVHDAAKSSMPELLSYFDGVKDTLDNPNNAARLIGKKYTGEKDTMLQTIVEGDGGAAWKFADARHISPLALLEESAAELSRTLSLNDLKHSAAMHWIEEAAPYLETPIDELRGDPWSHFFNPQWKGQYVDVANVRALDASRENVLGYMGLAKNKTETTVDWVKTKVMNSVYENKGGAAADWVDENVLPNIPDPIKFMRQFAFHAKLGLFNPTQPFIQGQTFFHTLAVTGNPMRAGSALAGLMLSTAGRQTVRREVLLGIDKKAQKLGWKAGEWLESHDLMRKLKLDVVEGEAGVLDMETAPKMFQSKGGAFLDKGLIFYKGIERAIRINAWHVAFKEFRDKFPTKVITNLEANEILARQEILSVNMTRSGNANWQRGILAPATQFMGYQARIMEQLVGHQLTKAEKARVMLTYGALYGVPVSLGAATFMQIPGASTDDIRQYALENGVDVNSGATGVVMNGIPAAFIQMITSDENGEGGYLFNIGERVGPGGSRTLRELWNGDKTVFSALFGASGSIAIDALSKVYPEDGDVIAAMAGAPSKSIADYANVFSTISTVSNTTKLTWALLTHRNMSRNGVDLGGIDSTSAVIRFMTGLEEQRFGDDGLRLKSLKEFPEYKKEIGKEYKAQYKKLLLLPVGSPERDLANTRMRALLEGVDSDTRESIVWQARQKDVPRDESVGESYKKKFPNSEGNN